MLNYFCKQSRPSALPRILFSFFSSAEQKQNKITQPSIMQPYIIYCVLIDCLSLAFQTVFIYISKESNTDWLVLYMILKNNHKICGKSCCQDNHIIFLTHILGKKTKIL